MKIRDFVDELEALLPVERVRRAKKEAQKEILQLKLAEVRKGMGVRQQDIKAFSQSGISKLESRSDMKISTLVAYMNSIGMEVEIRAYPKRRATKAKSILLLKK